jgi:hypothetical protein
MRACNDPGSDDRSMEDMVLAVGDTGVLHSPSRGLWGRPMGEGGGAPARLMCDGPLQRQDVTWMME